MLRTWVRMEIDKAMSPMKLKEKQTQTAPQKLDMYVALDVMGRDNKKDGSNDDDGCNGHPVFTLEPHESL